MFMELLKELSLRSDIVIIMYRNDANITLPFTSRLLAYYGSWFTYYYFILPLSFRPDGFLMNQHFPVIGSCFNFSRLWVYKIGAIYLTLNIYYTTNSGHKYLP